MLPLAIPGPKVIVCTALVLVAANPRLTLTSCSTAGLKLMASDAALRPPEPVGFGLSSITGTANVVPGTEGITRLDGMLNRGVTFKLTVAALPVSPVVGSVSL